MPVHVDAEEMRKFAAQLKRFSDVLGENMSGTNAQLGRLSESWKDNEFAQFRESFAKCYPLLKQFIEEANKTVVSLNRDAESIEAYAILKPE